MWLFGASKPCDFGRAEEQFRTTLRKGLTGLSIHGLSEHCFALVRCAGLLVEENERLEVNLERLTTWEMFWQDTFVAFYGCPISDIFVSLFFNRLVGLIPHFHFD